MNKKHMFIIWWIFISISILLGLKTVAIYKSFGTGLFYEGSDQNGLVLYGALILSAENVGKLSFLLYLGDYKYHLIFVSILFSLLLIYTFKSKNR